MSARLSEVLVAAEPQPPSAAPNLEAQGLHALGLHADLQSHQTGHSTEPSLIQGLGKHIRSSRSSTFSLDSYLLHFWACLPFFSSSQA